MTNLNKISWKLAPACAIVFLAAAFLSAGAPGNPEPGSATGTLTIDGKALRLACSYAMSQPNSMDPAKTDVAILITGSPLPNRTMKNLQDLYEATKDLNGFAYYVIDDTGKPTYEVVAHPSLGDTRLQMSGFTHASVTFKSLGMDKVAGSVDTKGPQDFLDHKYLIGVTFSAPVAEAAKPEPLPTAATGTKLPPDGGEPGAAYFAFEAAIRNKDLATVRKMKPAEEPDLTDEELTQRLELLSLLMATDVQITDGYIDGDHAVLYLTGMSEGEKQYGTAELVKTPETGWTMSKQNWSNVPPQTQPAP